MKVYIGDRIFCNEYGPGYVNRYHPMSSVSRGHKTEIPVYEVKFSDRRHYYTQGGIISAKERFQGLTLLERIVLGVE